MKVLEKKLMTCRVCEGSGCEDCNDGVAMDYTTNDLLYEAYRNKLRIEPTPSEVILRIRCIIALRNAGILD